MSKHIPEMTAQCPYCLRDMDDEVPVSERARIEALPDLIAALAGLYHLSGDLPTGKAYQEAAEAANAALKKANGEA